MIIHEIPEQRRRDYENAITGMMVTIMCIINHKVCPHIIRFLYQTEETMVGRTPTEQNTKDNTISSVVIVW